MHPERQSSDPFDGSYALVFACFAWDTSFVFPRGGGGEGTVTLGMFPRGCEDSVARRRLLSGGGGNNGMS